MLPRPNTSRRTSPIGTWSTSPLRQQLRRAAASAVVALAAASVGLAPQSASAAPHPNPASVGVTTGDNVNLRRGPGTSFAVIAQLARGARLEVLGSQAGWYRVATTRGTVGWVVDDFFSVGGNAAAAPAKAVNGIAIEDGVNLRSGPGTGYRSLGRIASETELDVLQRQGGWYQVRTPRGTVGWMSVELIALDTVAGHLAPGAGEAPAAANKVVAIAQAFLGARYIWGGASPSGFDCSGFTQYVYRQVGVRLPRKASQQFGMRNVQRIGAIKALQPGDLVYFERTTEERGVTHAGIYVGNGRMIAARSERLGVRYVSLYEPFWNSRFVGGVRP